jgi:hypothetical protein
MNTSSASKLSDADLLREIRNRPSVREAVFQSVNATRSQQPKSKRSYTDSEGFNSLDGIGMDPSEHRNAFRRTYGWMIKIYANKHNEPVLTGEVLEAALRSVSPGGRAHNYKPSTIVSCLSNGKKMGLWSVGYVRDKSGKWVNAWIPAKNPPADAFVYHREAWISAE